MHVWMYAESLQSCLTLCDPMGCSPPGSSAHGIFQATVLEWVAIAFSSKIATLFKIIVFIYLWLCWVFIAVVGFSLVAGSEGYS